MPPEALFLPDGLPLLVIPRENSGLELIGVRDRLHLAGIYAHSLNAILDSKEKHADRQRIALLERQHAWLHGLSRASRTPPHGLTPALLGSGLGMLFVEVTARCNERCIHCYADSTPERNEFLSLEEVCSALTTARAWGRPFVQFTGGDPLIHRDLVAMVAHARRLDFEEIEVYTNGLLLHERLLNELAPYRPRLSFSIYADTAEIHDAITRVPESWQRTLDAMQRAQNAGFDIRAGVVLMDENLACAERMNDFLGQRLGLAPEQIQYDAVNRVGRGHLLELSTDIRIVPSHAPLAGATRRGKLCLAANGDIHPCIFARDIRIGNIREQQLHTMLSGLERHRPAAPSRRRWNSCLEGLSCGDCRIAAYTIGGTERE